MKEIFYRIWFSDTLMTMSSYFVRVFNFFLLLPLLLKFLATEELALYYIFQTIWGVTSIINKGLEPNFIRLLSFALGGINEKNLDSIDAQIETTSSPNLQLLEKILQTMNIVYLVAAIIVFLGLASLGSVVILRPVSFLVNSVHGWIGWSVFTFVSFITIAVGSYNCILQAFGKIALLRKWESLTLLASFLGGAISLILELGFLGVVIAQQTILALGLVGKKMLAANVLHSYRLNKNTSSFDKKIFKIAWEKTYKTGIGILMHTGVFQLSSLFYAQIESPAKVASFLLGLKLINTISEFSKAPFYSKIPQMAKLYAAGKKDNLIKISQRGMKLSYSIFVFGFLAWAFFHERIFFYLKSKTEFISLHMWLLLGLAYFCERYAAMHLNLFTISNKIIWHKVYFVSGIIFLVVFFSTFNFLNLWSFPVGLLVSELGFSCWYNSKHTLNCYNIKFFQFEKRAVLPFAFVMAFSTVMFLL